MRSGRAARGVHDSQGTPPSSTRRELDLARERHLRRKRSLHVAEPLRALPLRAHQHARIMACAISVRSVQLGRSGPRTARRASVRAIVAAASTPSPIPSTVRMDGA